MTRMPRDERETSPQTVLYRELYDLLMLLGSHLPDWCPPFTRENGSPQSPFCSLYGLVWIRMDLLQVSLLINEQTAGKRKKTVFFDPVCLLIKSETWSKSRIRSDKL